MRMRDQQQHLALNRSLKPHINQAAVLRRIKAQLHKATTTPPSPKELPGFMNKVNPEESFEELYTVSRADATSVAQIRLEHSPLNSQPYCSRAADSLKCEVCLQTEDINHFQTLCRVFAGKHRPLLQEETPVAVAPNQFQLLTGLILFKDLATFGSKSFSFYQPQHQRPIPRATPEIPNQH